MLFFNLFWVLIQCFTNLVKNRICRELVSVLQSIDRLLLYSDFCSFLSSSNVIYISIVRSVLKATQIKPSAQHKEKKMGEGGTHSTLK